MKDDDSGEIISVKSDDVLGSIYLSVKELVKARTGLRWLNIYGAPTSTLSNATKVEMNNNPELASQWKGRILVYFNVERTKSPEARIRPVDLKFS